MNVCFWNWYPPEKDIILAQQFLSVDDVFSLKMSKMKMSTI